MKSVIYITKNKIWAGETAYDWDGKNMEEAWLRLRREQGVREARVVLGNEVSFVTAMKVDDAVINRENALKMARSWLPFEIDNECFDWKETELVPGEKWLQFIALQRELLEGLSLAVKKSGVRVDAVTAIGVILAAKTMDREVPVVVRWSGKEDILVVAVRGLADLVASEINEEDIMVYAKQKWGLAVNPEEVVFTDADVDVVDLVNAEKVRGEDRLVLNLPLLKEVVQTQESENKKGKKSVEGEEKKVVENGEKSEGEGEERSKQSHLWVYLVVLLVVLVVCGGVLWKMGFLTTFFGSSAGKKVETTALTSPTPTASPTAETVVWSRYTAQVLNGSGVSGEAAKVKKYLIELGIENIDTGNTEATNESQIRIKTDIPQAVADGVINVTKGYQLVPGSALTDLDKYDLIIVLGGNY